MSVYQYFSFDKRQISFFSFFVMTCALENASVANRTKNNTGDRKTPHPSQHGQG